MSKWRGAMPVVAHGVRNRGANGYSTGEDAAYVCNYLDYIGFQHRFNPKAGHIDICNPAKSSNWIRYWPTTGRWIPKNKLSTSHFRAYASKGIEDMAVRFMQGIYYGKNE
jgi:hypothetical protein